MIKTFSVAVLLAAAGSGFVLARPPQSLPRVTATRLSQNPLITLRTSSSLGDNLNGPTVIRVPEWVERPLGRYYMYFAHHMGRHIRLAYADAVEGPWRIHEPGVLPVSETALFRPQPDPVENLENFYTHVASPEIEVDPVNRRFVMWVHGWWTDGRTWPVGEPAARAWARQNGYAQFTQAATSTDGLSFRARPAITKISYLRVFRLDGARYGMARSGRLARAKDPLDSFELGPNPFRGGTYANRIRHVAVLQRGRRLHVFFTAIADAPERILMSTIEANGDWSTWVASPAVEVMAPEAPFECAALPAAPSEGGDIKGPARQLRDPALLDDAGRVFLFYSYCGEQGIAAAELTIQ